MKILELIKQPQEFLRVKTGAMQISRPIKDIFVANSWRPTKADLFSKFSNFPWDEINVSDSLSEFFLWND